MTENDNPPREKEEHEPQVRVTDRRWWARAQSGESTEDTPNNSLKPTYVEDLERRVSDATSQLQAVMNDRRREMEEFEQVKTRLRRDVGREVERGRRAILVDFLEVIDNLDRAIAAAAPRNTPQSPEADAIERLAHGVELVRDQFLSKLETLGVTRLSALGQPFDALRHEAVTTTPVGDGRLDGTVVAVIREGYAIGDDLLRPSSVVVGKHEP